MHLTKTSCTRHTLSVLPAVVLLFATAASGALIGLNNASFENGNNSGFVTNFTDWSEEGNVYEQPDGNSNFPDAPDGGSWLLLYEGDGSDAVYQQFGSFEANEQYDLTFTLGERNDGSAPFEGVIFEVRANGGTTSDTLLATSGNILPTFTDHTFTDTITLTPDQGVVSEGTPLYLRIQGGDVGGTSRSDEVVDNLSMTESIIPEPASLLLLGLGGVALLGRRNRRR